MAAVPRSNHSSTQSGRPSTSPRTPPWGASLLSTKGTEEDPHLVAFTFDGANLTDDDTGVRLAITVRERERESNASARAQSTWAAEYLRAHLASPPSPLSNAYSPQIASVERLNQSSHGVHTVAFWRVGSVKKEGHSAESWHTFRGRTKHIWAGPAMPHICKWGLPSGQFWVAQPTHSSRLCSRLTSQRFVRSWAAALLHMMRSHLAVTVWSLRGNSMACPLIHSPTLGLCTIGHPR